jgi:hypothetical protein
MKRIVRVIGIVSSIVAIVIVYNMQSASGTDASETPSITTSHPPNLPSGEPPTEEPLFEKAPTEEPFAEELLTEEPSFVATTKFDILHLFNSNCRTGPGVYYDSLTKIPPGTQVDVFDRDPYSGKWLLIKWEKLLTQCWIDSSLLDYDFDINILPSSMTILPPPKTVVTLGGDGNNGNDGSHNGNDGGGCTEKEVQVCEDIVTTVDVCVKETGNGKKCLEWEQQERMIKVCHTEIECE